MKKIVYPSLIFALIVRVVTILFIDKTPCMESTYYAIGRDILNGTIESIQLPPFYSLLIFKLSSILGSLFIATTILYIVFGFMISLYIYLIAKLLFDEKTAIIALIVSIFLPNLTVSVAGYSHSVVVGLGLELIGIYYLIKSFDSFKFQELIVGVIFSTLSISIRPEILIVNGVLTALLTIYSAIITKRRLEATIFSTIYAFTIFTLLFIHSNYIKENSLDKSHPGIFTDKKYSYMTMIHTYSLRNYGIIDDSLAIKASEKEVGTPLENDYSIRKLIIKNPKQFLVNGFYNLKELLDSMAHPLFMPFYYFILIGFFIKAKPITEHEKKSLVILASILVMHIFPLLIFHVEMRYMLPIASILIILIAKAITYSTNSKFIIVATTFLTFLIYAAYAINFRSLESLCELIVH